MSRRVSKLDRVMWRRLPMILVALTAALSCNALSLSLDSIAEWGKFPRFCVNTYRWGDKFFNGYDTLFVHGTGYKFNAKLRTESWTDMYHLKFENKSEMEMLSSPSTSAGIYLTYLALSAGYDINVSKYFNGGERARKRWNFQFNCMLFAADLYFSKNDVGTKVTSYSELDKPEVRPNLKFYGINNTEWGLSAYYFINHRRYSQAAAFNFSRVQARSGGSFYVGFSFSRQDYDFDFSGLPDEVKAIFPPSLDDHYVVNNHNYYLTGGYGYNWVFAPKWMLGVTEAPMIGWTEGYISSPGNDHTTFALLNRFKLSVVFNHDRWFAGVVMSSQTGLVGDKHRTVLNSYLTVEVSAGCRFNLW